jgi:selenocysteine lyase/cysteine desulfurase
MLSSFQKDFVATNGIYFLSHSVGRPLVQAQSNFDKIFFDAWQSAEPWKQWMPVFADFQQSLATLLGSKAQNFCPQSNLSSALTKILFSLPKQATKNKILLSENDFPSIVFVATQAKTLGYELVFLPKNADETNPQVWADACTPDVQWLLLTHVQSNTGVQVPVTEIIAEANRRNILSVVDIAQSVGILPIDVEAWQASFVIGSCVKWLCGGAGAGFLWANSTIVENCKPVDVGWFSHQNPFAFDIHHFEYHTTALRFWGGTPSVMPYILATQSINYFANLGITTVRNHNLALTQKIIDHFSQKFPKNSALSPIEPNRRSATVILHFGEKQQEMLTKFQENKIQFDVRNIGMRISPHIYNTMEDVESLFM